MDKLAQSDKKPKTWDEAIKELSAFIKATKEHEAKQESKDKK